MNHAEYLSKHGGDAVELLLNQMELAVDNKHSDLRKWFLVQKAAKAFTKEVWAIYKQSKKGI